MRLIWDEPKRLANLDKHGMDFADLSLDFFLGAVVIPAKEGRFMAIGRLEAGPIAVVFAPLGSEAIAVISMRPAGARERRLL